MNQSDHDLLIVIHEGQRELKGDVRAMSDALKEMKAALDQTREQQRDQDSRLVNLTNTVVRLQADQRDDHKDLGDLKTDHLRWKLYAKVAVILLSPVYLIILFAAEQALKTYLFP